MAWLLVAVAAVYGIQLVILVANLRHVARSRQGRPPADPPLLSVLIPARNEAANLERLLPGLLAQDHPAFEVVVVDDGSEDRTPDVLSGVTDSRLIVHRTAGPAPGWIGKPHALYVATRIARGRRYLFLDADVSLLGPDALSAIAAAYENLPEGRVLTGLPRFVGGGLMLVSQVPAAILGALPWPLVPLSRRHPIGGVNGQCWMIGSDVYHRHEPHAAHRRAVLEDVAIGRLLIRAGHPPVLADLRRRVAVRMYDNFASAWAGFRKNAYLIMGGRPWLFVPLWIVYVAAYLIAPVLWPFLFAPLFALKAVTDRYAGMPAWVTVATPVSYLVTAILQIDSFVAHLTGRVRWKGRRVGRTSLPIPESSP